MNRTTIRTVIILGTIALIGIIASQLYFINSAENIHEQELELHRKELARQNQQQKLLEDEFNDRVKVALSNVAQEILTIYNDPAEIYKAVEQLSSNYFMVRINDTLHPGLLEQLLRRELDQNSISEPFQYGIYDCFNDSIVYGNYVNIQSERDTLGLTSAQPIKWESDGHYFSVRFPKRKNISMATDGDGNDLHVRNMNTAYAIAIVGILIILLFFSYSIYIILKQKRISEVKNDFINNMTHELKTPISTIAISSETLSNPKISEHPDRILQYARIIQAENKRLESQVERVLQLAKIDRGEIELKESIFDLHTVIQQSMNHFKLQTERKGGTFKCLLNADNSTVNGDEVHLTNILYNLIDNALKYSDDQPEIEVRSENLSGGIQVSISDNGLGIKSEHIKHIFDKFYRVPAGNLHDVKGFGLGLYYVKTMVEQHGGWVKAKSKPARGSTFTFWLPQNK